MSVPAIKSPTSLDFETSVFKKEKINLAGHEEVFFFLFIDSILLCQNRFMGSSVDFEKWVL